MNWNDKALFVRNMAVLEKHGVFMFNVDKKIYNGRQVQNHIIYHN